MKIENLPKASGGALRTFQRALPASTFRAFYLAELRPVPGRRISSADLYAAYQAWATEGERMGLDFKELAREMEALGHRRTRSNGIYWRDVAFALDHPARPPSLPGSAELPQTAVTASLVTDAMAEVRRAAQQLSSALALLQSICEIKQAAG